MSPRPLAFATILAATTVLALPVQAQIWPFGRDDDDVAGATAETTAATPSAPSQAQRQPASAEQRAQANRLDPLPRAVFWAAEITINPADIEAYLHLSRAQRDLGRYDEAATSAQQALVVAPANTDAMMALARAKIAQGQGFYAIAPLQQVRAMQAGNWEAASLLGVAYEQVERRDEARQAWTEALSLSPENPAVLTNMALAMAGSGQTGEAEALMRRAVAQPGATLQMRLNLALILGLQGRVPEAEQILRRELPPEQVEQNLTWLRRAANSQGEPTSGRTWGAMTGG